MNLPLYYYEIIIFILVILFILKAPLPNINVASSVFGGFFV